LTWARSPPLAACDIQARDAAQYSAVLVPAGAGTGKTRRLTAALAQRVAEVGTSTAQLLAVTFINKAVERRTDDRQADEAFGRFINTPVRGFGAKAMKILEAEAAWRQVLLVTVSETALLLPKTRRAGLGFVDSARR
jgi:DNA helicase II / ATP-dependent DNA helicase PcrA